MTTAILRGGAGGIRTEKALEVLCPHCGKHGLHELSGRADTDARGRVLHVWEVVPRPGDHTVAEVERIYAARSTAIEKGIALPETSRRTPEVPSDPVPF